MGCGVSGPAVERLPAGRCHKHMPWSLEEDGQRGGTSTGDPQGSRSTKSYLRWPTLIICPASSMVASITHPAWARAAAWVMTLRPRVRYEEGRPSLAWTRETDGTWGGRRRW